MGFPAIIAQTWIVIRARKNLGKVRAPAAAGSKGGAGIKFIDACLDLECEETLTEAF